jgi:uncharacterized protein with PIN domain
VRISVVAAEQRELIVEHRHIAPRLGAMHIAGDAGKAHLDQPRAVAEIVLPMRPGCERLLFKGSDFSQTDIDAAI